MVSTTMATSGRGERFVGDTRERLVDDALIRCPYLRHQIARLPLRLPVRPLSGDALARRLRAGDRRQGVFLYRPTCPSCHACEAIRIEVESFAPNKTQRRIFRRGEARLRTQLARPTITPEKVALYNRHKVERGLRIGDEPTGAAAYQQFLVDSCTDTIELTYRMEGTLVGVAIADRAADALSAVYCYYDPAAASLSPGVYSILKQLALCRTWGLRYLYLGLYIADCPAMAYKARYLPHERLVGGVWRRFDRE